MQDEERPQEEQTEEDIELISDSEDDEPAPARKAQEAPADDWKDKYLRLYADFDNYRKRVNREKEDLVRYGNEALLYDFLPAIDNLELALRHATGEMNSGLMQGVEVTLKELQRTLEKFGLVRIEAAGKAFDPAVHHAMSQVERADMEEKMIAEEFRAGYRYREKVLRPSLVAVSIKPAKQQNDDAAASDNNNDSTIEEDQ